MRRHKKNKTCYGIIYVIINIINNKQYVGQTINSIQHRFDQHCYLATTDSNVPIISAIRKYGKDSFSINMLEECADFDDLNNKEKYWIKKMNTYNIGYNATTGGDSFEISKKSRLKMSKAHKGKTLSNETKRKISLSNQGQIPWIKGKKHSEETKRKISLGNMGKVRPPKAGKVTDETRANISKANKGKVPWNKGKKMSEETRKKMSNAKKNMIFSDEHRKNLSIAQKGRPSPMKGQQHSEETKNKISLANKGQIPWNKGLKMKVKA